MRNSSLAWFLVFAPAAAYACGGSDNSLGDGGNNDATVNDGPGGDSPSNKDTGAQDTGGNDSSSGDAGNDSASGNDGSGSDGGTSQIACTFPAECIDGGNLDAAYPPSSGEVCCATVTTTGTAGSCTITNVTTKCAAPTSCATNVNYFKCTTDTLRACAHGSECTETGFNQCCYVATDAGKAQACMSSTMISVLKATCVP